VTARLKGTCKSLKEKPRVTMYWDELNWIADYFDFNILVFLLPRSELKKRFFGKKRIMAKK